MQHVLVSNIIQYKSMPAIKQASQIEVVHVTERRRRHGKERRGGQKVTAVYRAVTALSRPDVDVALCPRGTSCSPCMDLPWLKAAAAESSLATYMRACPWLLAFLFFSYTSDTRLALHPHS